jgi:hypothetical protein
VPKTPETNQPTVPHELPWLSIFEVRCELEPHTNIDGFDREIDHLVARAAESGSLDELQRSLRSWLGVALVAENPDGLVDLDIHERGRYIDQLLEAWFEQRTPDSWRRPPSAGPADESRDRVQWAVRITARGGAMVSRPYGTKQTAQEHIARIRAARPDDDGDRVVEPVWRRVHPWSIGEPDGGDV